jgi:hypothetical protein
MEDKREEGRSGRKEGKGSEKEGCIYIERGWTCAGRLGGVRTRREVGMITMEGKERRAQTESREG